jgi:hypothetical protein
MQTAQAAAETVAVQNIQRSKSNAVGQCMLVDFSTAADASMGARPCNRRTRRVAAVQPAAAAAAAAVT